ncbi:molybdopterin-dependent oxidoreductase [Halosegnis sp.]|uniref:molybdopterin-dependent oxidoreductase n=1 Tax=Halosegnis sp. TaxID=2864959 RepID=UPI0035D3F149
MDTDAVRSTIAQTLVPALAAALAAVGGSFAVAGFTPAFVPAALASAVARLSPGALVTFAITVLGDLGKLLNIAMGFALGVGLFGALTAIAIAVGRRTDMAVASPVLAGVSVFAAAALLTDTLFASLVGGFAAAVVLAVGPVLAYLPATTGVAPGRRHALGTVGTALATVGLGYAVGRNRGDGPSREPVTDPEVRSLLDDATAKSLSVEGLEPLVSDQFYTVDIAAAAPTITADEWTLSVTGNVEQEVEIDYDELTGMESREVFATLRCVGESLNGKKMDTALWTVVPAAELVDRAGASGNCCVMLRAADGYYEEFPLSALREGLFAYRMNGRPLPRGHGYPVRALIPGHWGEINVKWVTEIEVLDEEVDGYWEKKGWHGTGPVNTVAKLHAVDRADGQITVAGHAYAGTRGISAVEVSTDGGATWTEATLSEPLPSPEADRAIDAWRQWAHEYEAPGGRHEVVVRAREADGTLQPREETGAYPSGPSGWVSKEIG